MTPLSVFLMPTVGLTFVWVNGAKRRRNVCGRNCFTMGVRKGKGFPCLGLCRKGPDGPALVDELIRNMEPNHSDLVDELRDPEANREHMGEPYKLGSVSYTHLTLPTKRIV